MSTLSVILILIAMQCEEIGVDTRHFLKCKNSAKPQSLDARGGKGPALEHNQTLLRTLD